MEKQKMKHGIIYTYCMTITRNRRELVKSILFSSNIIINLSNSLSFTRSRLPNGLHGLPPNQVHEYRTSILQRDIWVETGNRKED